MSKKSLKEGSRVHVLDPDRGNYDGTIIDDLSVQFFVLTDDGDERFAFKSECRPCETKAHKS